MLAELLLAIAVREHQVAVADFARQRYTHVCTTGILIYKKPEADGDIHYKVSDPQQNFIIGEVTPQTPLPQPFDAQSGDIVEICGRRRYDDAYGHGWWEVNPVEHARVLTRRKGGASRPPGSRKEQLVAKSAARGGRSAGVRNAGGRTVTRTSGTNKTITRPAGKAKTAVPAAARGSKRAGAPRGRVAVPATAARPGAGQPAAARGGRKAATPADDAATARRQQLSPEGQAERDNKLTALRADRDQVQRQYDTIKGLPQYATEAATFAARLADLDNQIKEAAADAGQPAQE